MHLSQTKYIHDLLTRTNMHLSKPSSSPMATGSVLTNEPDSSFEDPHLYRSVVGALQYATLTRPDISFAVNKVSQYMHQPSANHWIAVKQILRYLHGTLTHGLFFSSKSDFSLHAYSEFSLCIFLGPNLISWSAKKQATVSCSSTEAEYRNLANTYVEMLWLCYLLQELHITIPHQPTLWCDNIGATFLASNLMFHAHTKHVEIDYYFVRENIASNALCVRFICSQDQLANLLTKPLPIPQFAHLRSKLNVISPHSV